MCAACRSVGTCKLTEARRRLREVELGLPGKMPQVSVGTIGAALNHPSISPVLSTGLNGWNFKGKPGKCWYGQG